MLVHGSLPLGSEHLRFIAFDDPDPRVRGQAMTSLTWSEEHPGPGDLRDLDDLARGFRITADSAFSSYANLARRALQRGDADLLRAVVTAWTEFVGLSLGFQGDPLRSVSDLSHKLERLRPYHSPSAFAQAFPWLAQ